MMPDARPGALSTATRLYLAAGLLALTLGLPRTYAVSESSGLTPISGRQLDLRVPISVAIVLAVVVARRIGSRSAQLTSLAIALALTVYSLGRYVRVVDIRVKVALALALLLLVSAWRTLRHPVQATTR